MSAFQRDQQRAIATGICLNAPKDLCPPGKWPYLQNVRSYQAGTLQARLGLALITGGFIGGGLIHSITRLNDPTTFAATPFWRVFGASVNLRAGATSYPVIDTGYSGNPLTFCTAAPIGAPNPYVYIGDSSRMRKIDVNAHVYPIGIAPPLAEPSAVVSPLPGNFISAVNNPAQWMPAGAAAGALSSVFRCNTTISAIIYDSGATGNASVVPASMSGINTDAVITFGGVESLVVLQVCLPIVTTTIGSIIYDTGTTGLCTIQPTASLGTGQIDAPTFADYAARAGGYGGFDALQRAAQAGGDISAALRWAEEIGGSEAVAQTRDALLHGSLSNTAQWNTLSNQARGLPTSTIRQIDFPVNCLIMINAVELVRVLSVNVGPDGIQSFRCSTAGTYTAGQSLTGTSSFRVNSVATYAIGNTLQASALENTITPSGSPGTATAGIQTVAPFTPVNNPAIQWNGVATLPEDDFHISVRLSNCTPVTAIRIYLDVDAATNDFTQNYYFYEWRANDIIAAIQGSNTDPTATLQQVRPNVVANVQLNATQTVAGAQPSLTTGGPTQDAATSQALALGNNQWLELHCKVGDLLRIGTDPSRSLQNVAGVEIIVAMVGEDPISVDYGSIYLSGGNNPDCGYTGAPRVYAYRYRSSITGARSNPSPTTRGGLIPRRQSVGLTGTQSPDTQCDLVDWYVMEGPSGSIDRMTYLGTNLNSNPPTFLDNYGAQRVVGGPILDYTIFQPWATTDRNRSATVNVAGSAVRRTGGTDTFNTSWAPGSLIIINGQPYTLRRQPTNTTFLEINENAGSITGGTAVLPQPTILNTLLRGYWGPDIEGVYYGCGDAGNPGFLYWTFPNDPDRHSDANGVQVTSGSERLQNGFVYDDRPYVFSSDNLYAILSGPNNGRVATITPCGKGAWTPWFFCVGPDGTYFGTKDGIYVTVGGSPAKSISDQDLYPLFPHDGTVGVTVNGVLPPDFSQTTRLRLAYVDGWIYFDYLDTGGNSRTLAYQIATDAWWFDIYTPGIACRLSAGGNAVYEELIGGADGHVYQPSGTSDNAVAFTAQALRIQNQGDARLQKLYRDCMVEADLTASTMTVALTVSNEQTSLGSLVIGGNAGRQEYQVPILPTTGAFGKNLGTQLTWVPVQVGVPLLYLTDVAFQNEVEAARSWLSGPTTFGLTGYLQIMGCYVCYISTAAVTLSLIIDNVLYTYTLPNSGGVYAKYWVWLRTVKGLAFQLGFQSTAAFLLFDKDLEFFIQPWGVPGGYRQVRPF